MATPTKLSAAIRMFLADKRSERRSPATIETYERRLRYFADWAGDIDTTDIGRALLVDYQAYLNEKSPEGPRKFSGEQAIQAITVNSYMRALRAFFNWCVNTSDPPLMETVPIKTRAYGRGVTMVKGTTTHTIKTITEPDFHRLLATCNLRLNKGRRDYAIMAFLYDTGVRVNELCTLGAEDVDLKRGTASVVGKGNKRRTVFFSATTASALLKYRSLMSKDYKGCSTFFEAWGRPMVPGTVNQMLERRKLEAAIKSEVHPHNWRHTFATNMLRNGCDISFVSRMLGHASVEITAKVYAHLLNEDLADAHAAFSPMERAMGKRRAS